MNPEVLKSYLIKLGIQVDDKAFNKIKSTISELTNVLTKSASSSTGMFVKGMSSVVTAVVAVDLAIIKTIDSVAKADLSYTLFAQKMFMNVEAAKAFKLSTEALGHSLSEIAWNAELKEKYFILVKQINELQTPPEAKDMLKQVRGIGFEFTRMKVAATSSIEWITYHLLKLNKGELSELRARFGGWVDKFIKNIPEMSERIAVLFQPFIQLTTSAIKVLEALWGVIRPVGEFVIGLLKSIWEGFQNVHREALLLIALLSPVFLVGSPLLMGIAAFLSLLLLIDDAMAFNEGRASLELLAPLWNMMTWAAHGFNMALISVMTTWDFLMGRSRTGNWAKDMKENLGDYAMQVEQSQKDWEKKRAASKKAMDDANKKVGAPSGAVSSAAPQTGEPGELQGMSKEQTSAYMAGVKRTEADKRDNKSVNTFGFVGRYQFGADALADEGLVDQKKLKAAKKEAGKDWYKKGLHKSFLEDEANWNIKGGQKSFLEDAALQDKSMVSYTNKNIAGGMKSGAISNQSSPQDIAAYAKAAHLKGTKAADNYFLYGVDSKDAYGTKISKYAGQGAEDVAKVLAPVVTQAPTQAPVIAQTPRVPLPAESPLQPQYAGFDPTKLNLRSLPVNPKPYEGGHALATGTASNTMLDLMSANNPFIKGVVSMGDFFRDMKDYLKGMGGNNLPGVPKLAYAQPPAGAINTSNFYIYGATDPQAVGKAVEDMINKTNADAVTREKRRNLIYKVGVGG